MRDTWIGWGVPGREMRRRKTGRQRPQPYIEIAALEAFDRTALVTASEGEVLRGKMPQDMDLIAVNYFVQNIRRKLVSRRRFPLLQLFRKTRKRSPSGCLLRGIR